MPEIVRSTARTVFSDKIELTRSLKWKKSSPLLGGWGSAIYLTRTLKWKNKNQVPGCWAVAKGWEREGRSIRGQGVIDSNEKKIKSPDHLIIKILFLFGDPRVVDAFVCHRKAILRLSTALVETTTGWVASAPHGLLDKNPSLYFLSDKFI